MGMRLNFNSVNQAEKGTVIYNVKEPLTSICMIVKGRVLVMNNGAKMILGSGSFLGISELNVGHYINTYIAYDDVTFYCFSLSSKDDVSKIFAMNHDYRGLMAASMAKYLYELDKTYQSLIAYSEQVYQFIRSNYSNYLETGSKLGYPTKTINSIEELVPYEFNMNIDEEKLEFYRESAKVPLDGWKAFCAGSDTIVLYFVAEISELIVQLTMESTELSTYMARAFENLMNKSESCLFKSIASLAIAIDDAGGYNNELVRVLDNIIEEINLVEKLFDEKTGLHLEVSREQMEEIYFVLLSKESNRSEQMEDGFKYSQQELQQMTNVLNNSLKQIIHYGKLDEEKGAKLEQQVLNFMNLKDKHSAEDSARVLRKQLAEGFYELYERVFLIAYHDANVPKAVNLFLKYGYLDERLLNKEQLKELYFLKDTEENAGPCNVYTIKDWLSEIYKGNKEPSKNEFDLDYRDMLREERKKGKITEAEEKDMMVNSTKKVIYEMRNMFRYNHRLVNGQITTFVPFLNSDSILQSLNKLYVSAERINRELTELLNIDYSVFHREILYVDNEKGIEKEYIMKQVYPDIILMPTVGYNGVMWQEISEKRKSKEGRFLLPVFTEVVLKDLLIKLLGRFRWELCRTIQGSSWNNIKYKSLTSEYSDYLQFYRKNNNLSEEVKEKVKSQIQKGRNNYREIFLIDYESWMKSESSGGIRLNKVARELMATYCPFSKTIRERLNGQPLFSDAMARSERNNLKKVKEFELRYRALEKDKVEITEELMENLMFYRDL
jgi:hypothetical protein